jgi:hypothetical protein
MAHAYTGFRRIPALTIRYYGINTLSQNYTCSRADPFLTIRCCGLRSATGADPDLRTPRWFATAQGPKQSDAGGHQAREQAHKVRAELFTGMARCIRLRGDMGMGFYKIGRAPSKVSITILYVKNYPDGKFDILRRHSI